MPKSSITKEMERFIRDNYRTRLASDMAGDLGVGKSAVRKWMRKHGLAMPKDTMNRLRTASLAGRTRVTPEQDAFIRDNYLTMPQKHIAAKLGFSHTCLKVRLRQLGLEIPKEVRKKFSEASQFTHGDVPPNKGRKQSEFMSAEGIERSKATRFKKGDMPHNCYHEVGRISVRHDSKTGIAYQYKCIEIAKWVPLHTLNWEQANGPIPKGYCLWFRDRNSLNCDLSNLELITRRENMLRNQMADGTIATRMAVKRGGRGVVDTELREELLKHPELLELKRQQILLQREIKNHGKTENDR